MLSILEKTEKEPPAKIGFFNTKKFNENVYRKY